MAVEIPVVVDIESALKNAAAQAASAAKPLEEQMDKIAQRIGESMQTSVSPLTEKLEDDSTRIGKSIAKMQKVAMKGLGDGTIEKLDAEMARYADSARRAAQRIAKLAEAQGTLKADNVNIRGISQQITVLAEKWKTLKLGEKFDSDGKLRNKAQDIIDKLSTLVTKAQRFGEALSGSTKAAAEAEMQHVQALTQTGNTLDALNVKLAEWRKELAVVEQGSQDFINISKIVQQLVGQIQNLNAATKIFGSETKSIDQISTGMRELNRQYMALSESDRKGAVGKQKIAEYRVLAEYMDKEVMDLQKIYQMEKRLQDYGMTRQRTRQYEEAVLNSTANTMHRLSEQARILSERLNKAKFGTKQWEDLRDRLDLVRQKMKDVQGETSGVNAAMTKQSGILKSLASYASMYFSVFGAIRFIKNVRETTAEFEMQRVALAGIIQDANKAEALFKQIKAAAIESPFQIKQLVTYTKQLSAYRIETDQLFDVTKRLADVSAGLGVDMNRLVLAYGQVRSASVLRGQELRQFTEAGIPLVDLLAKKFQELGREGTTTADVFELISKRAVPFSMIAEIFEDMTDKGGIFYKMQEKQADTLAGQWSNLKDALSIMYDEIGNTATVHNAMEKLIADAKFLFNNWRIVGGILKSVAVQFIAIKAASLFIPVLTRNTALAAKATEAKARASQLEAANEKRSLLVRTVAISQLKTYAKHMSMAANATTLLGRTWHRLAANFLGGGWISLAVTALSVLVGWIISARKEAERLGEALSENIAKGGIQAEQSVRNFERLANTAIKAAAGSAEQRDALKELQRTYGDIIPVQDLEIEKLKALEGNYESLTRAIREKIEVQVHEQNISQIQDTYASSLGKQRKGLEKFLTDTEGYSTEEANRIIAGVEKAIKDGLLTIETDFMQAALIIENIAKEQIGRAPLAGFGQAFQQKSGFLQVRSYYQKLLKSTSEFNSNLQQEEERFNGLNNALGIYAERMKEIRAETEKTPEGFTLGQAGSFEYNQARWKQAVEKYKKELVNAFGGIDISDAFGVDDFIDFGKIFKKVSSSNGTLELKNFVSEIQKDYLKLAPQEASTRLIVQGAQEIASGIGIAMSDIQGYLKEDGKSMEDYAKDVQGFVDAQKSKVAELEWQQKNFRAGESNYIRPTDQDIANEKKELDFLEKLLAFIAQFVTVTKSGGGYVKDPFIDMMNERMKFMQDFKKGYEDLNKYLAHDDALAKTAEQMKARGLSLGIDLSEQKMAAKELSEWYEKQMNDAFEAARKHGARGSNYMDFLSQVISDNSNQGRALKEFQKLIQSLFDAKTDIDLSNLKKNIEDEFKRLKEEIKRGEVGRSFFNDILEMTGDRELSAQLTMSIYGDAAKDLEDNLKKSLEKSMVIDASKLPENFEMPNIADAITNKDTKTLRSVLGYVVDEYRSAAEEIISTWENEEAEWIKGLYKTYAKVKDFDERIKEVRARESESRTRIQADKNLPQSEKDILINASLKKEAKEVADIQVEILKNSYEWTKAFEDLDRVGNTTLANLRKKILDLIDAQKESLDPEQLKALREELEKIRKVQIERNPFSAISSGAIRSLLIMGAMREEKGSSEYDKALEKIREYNAKVQETDRIDLEHLEDSLRNANKDMDDGIKGLSEYMSLWKNVIDTVTDAFNLDEIPILGETLQGISDALSFVATILPVIITLTTALSIAVNSIPFVAILTAIVAALGAIAGLIKGIINAKVEKLDKQIEEQKKLIDDLEYSYRRLEKAIEKSFGSEYIYNYNKQLEVLLAKVEAYQKQAELEREKGKKADEEKVQDYIDQARDAQDQISEMQTQLSEFFAGTNMASAAEDFANAWIEAYKEFGSTTDAMSEKFNEMINSMINRSLAAKIMQEMLQPVFDQIDSMARDGLLATDEIASIAALAQERIPLINDAMTNLMSSLASAGLDVRTSTAGFKGISKDIAGASEESILGLAAAVNTQNFYMSYMPTINENVAAILAAMTGSQAGTNRMNAPAAGNAGEDVMPSVQQMIYDHLPMMDQNLAEILRLVKSVITTKTSATNTNYVAVR